MTNTETLTGTTTRTITFGNTQTAVTLPAGTIVEFHPAAITNAGLVYTRVVGRRLAEVLPITLITSL
jgi:hypothetical protein